MNAKSLVAASLALNVVLLGWAGYQWEFEKFAAHAKVDTLSSSPQFAPSSPIPRFHWSQVEAGDYPAYIANLRAIGCPEPTIRDIITADIANRSDLQPGAPYENSRPEALQNLTQEQQRLIATLLPVAPEDNAIPAISAAHLSPPAVSQTSFSLGPIRNVRAAEATVASEQQSLIDGGSGTPANPTASTGPEEQTVTEMNAPTADSVAPAEGLQQQGFSYDELVFRAQYGWHAFNSELTRSAGQRLTKTPAQ